ncbi:hypothetical protein ACE6H2_023860 [Prunus campanulata]
MIFDFHGLGGAKKIHGSSSSRQSHEIASVNDKPPIGLQVHPAPAVMMMPNSVFFGLYVLLGVLLFWKMNKSYLEALYGSVVILTEVGYGDLVPVAEVDKVQMCLFICFGFFFVADRVEETIDHIQYMVVMWLRRKGWYFKIPYINFLLAVAGILLLVGSGTVAIIFIEGKECADAFYLTVASITTVGFGDQSFKSTGGKKFATFWLLLSTNVAKRLAKWLSAQLNYHRFEYMASTSRRGD